MAFEDTVKELRNLLMQVTQDLEKSALGNKAASQRVRTGTVKLEKIAKQYRKDSISNERRSVGATGGRARRTSAKESSALGSARGARSKTAAQGARGRATAARTTATRAGRTSKATEAKKATAKLPTRKTRSSGW